MAKKTERTLSMINTLASAAYPINDDDWGSERQIAAENAFFAFVKDYVTRGPRAVEGRKQWEDFEGWCLKATTEEMIEEALRGLLGLHRRPGETQWR